MLEMDTQFRELVPFLRDRNPEVRRLALSNLISQTPKDSPCRSIFDENHVISDLKLLCRDQLSTAHDAFRALVNLSDSPLVIANLSDDQFLQFLVSYIITPNAILADLASMLLSNLTASSATCSSLIALKIPIISVQSLLTGYYATQSRCGTCVAPEPYPSKQSHDVLALPLLVDAFARAAQIDTAGKRVLSRKGELHFLASVFANLSAVPAGHEFFLTPRSVNGSENEYPLSTIVAFTEHQDTIRRSGVASTIKNCAFHIPAHRAFLSPDSTKVSVPPSKLEGPGIDVLPYLLLPLAGPEEFDLEDQEKLPPTLQFLPPTKIREPDPSLRLTHLETLILLCTTRWGREFQRANGVYEIIRATHEIEKIDKISEHIEKLVNLLKRGEGACPRDGDENTFTTQITDRNDLVSDVEDEDHAIMEV